jgi:hypothetical protein
MRPRPSGSIRRLGDANTAEYFAFDEIDGAY